MKSFMQAQDMQFSAVKFLLLMNVKSERTPPSRVKNSLHLLDLNQSFPLSSLCRGQNKMKYFEKFEVDSFSLVAIVHVHDIGIDIQTDRP